MDREALKKDLTRDEAYRRFIYKCTAGKWTIGIGRNLDDRGVTIEEALYLLDNDILLTERELDINLPWWRAMTEPRQRVLANMCFNLGVKRLLLFRRTLEAMERGDYKTAANEMLTSSWAHQVGARSKRLSETMRSGA